MVVAGRRALFGFSCGEVIETAVMLNLWLTAFVFHDLTTSGDNNNMILLLGMVERKKSGQFKTTAKRYWLIEQRG